MNQSRLKIENANPNLKLLLLDGHSLAFRAFYALPVENFRTSSMQATNAIYGFIRMLIVLIEKIHPDLIAIAFDEAKSTFRHKKYLAYKAQRSPTPDDFKTQIPILKNLLNYIGIKWFSHPEYEADDILATLATKADESRLKSYIVTGDRDALQLVSESITVLYPTSGVSQMTDFTIAKVEEKYAVTPEQYPDLAALRGDSSDNLPGVPGVGEKTAAKWLKTYKNLSGIIANSDNITGKVGVALRENLEQILTNRELTTLVRTVPLDTEVKQLTLGVFNKHEVLSLCEQLEFNSIKQNIIKTFNKESNIEVNSLNIREINYTATYLDSEKFISWLNTNTNSVYILVFDIFFVTETQSYDIEYLVINDDSQSIWVNFSELTTVARQTLVDWLINPNISKAGHDFKLAIRALLQEKIHIAGIVFDTKLAAYLINSNSKNYTVEFLSTKYLGVELESITQEFNQQLTLLDSVANDAEKIDSLVVKANLIKKLMVIFSEMLKKNDQEKILSDIELPLELVLAEIETTGFKVNKYKLEELLIDFQSQVETAAQKSYNIIGTEINLNSPKQLQEVLFEQLKMPKTKKTKTGYTTDAKALQYLYTKTQHPFLEQLLLHRDRIKLKQVVETLMKSISYDSKIHTTFNQTIAATGRLSSTDPNLQNIPTRSIAGHEIRSAFVKDDKFETLLTADYSQIEMRIMAHLCADNDLITAFCAGEDLHKYVGAAIFNVSLQDVTEELRRRVKAISYGLVYGLSAYGLAQQLQIPEPEARALMDKYFSRFSKVRDYLQSVVSKASATGYTETILGRKRYFPELASSNSVIRKMAERAALNAPIQGSAADIIKIAMISIARNLRELHYKSRMILQIHDELIFEVASGEMESLKELINYEMSNAVKLSVPLEISFGAGLNWDVAAHSR